VRRRFAYLSLWSLVVVLGANAASAQKLQPLEPDWVRQMYKAGWKDLQKGILQRDTGGGRLETFGYGAEGLRWLVLRYEKQLRYFEGKYTEAPNDDLATVIDKLRTKIDDLSSEVQMTPSAEAFDGAALSGCSLTYDATSSAGPLNPGQGVTATANAFIESNCYIGNTFAWAYAHAINGTDENTVTQTDPKNGVYSAISDSKASASGSEGCESRAQASVEVSALNIYYLSPEAVSYNCPLNDHVSASGPAQVVTDYYGTPCADVTWTASTLTGNANYTYEWYIGATLEGTGPTLTKRYCNEDATVTVRVAASDNAGWSDSSTFTTTIQNIEPVVAWISGPVTVTTDYYSSSCATVTWTASASGGHPGGYTYSWYIGTDPAVQGTGSTFAKSYCNANQPVTVTVVVKDSDGHADDATYTTNLQYIGPVTASISGPVTVATDYYSSTCADVTWTASAMGGHPGYTYSWYLGSDPTVQGTDSTLTKRYCNANQSVAVKVVVKDSDGHTKEATYATNVQYIGPMAVSVSGPATVNTDYYYSACADATWTANLTGGHPGYTYSWYLGSDPTVQGTDSTFTKNYCSVNQSVTVKVVVKDSDGHTQEATFTTNIRYVGPVVASISGPSTVTTDYYGSTCATVTWTASATGGHPGYTYSWYLGTSTTVQGTGSTFSQSYCSTSQSVTVKVIAQDSDGHTDSVTKTTQVKHISAVAASISGPATATTDYYGLTCASVTWTASTTGGHPGYTYSWYLGTGTTVQGTGSTFTKSYCSTSQSVSVKVVARDSDGHTDSATFTTSVKYRDAIVAKITGPATVSTSSTASCADVTWTASASSSGHSGFTYKWYLGTSTTVQGTASTLTKRYCSTTQTVTVKLIATASDGDSDSVTFSTKITHTSTAPLAASISGESEAYLLSATDCHDLTWSANVSGGTPAYTYSWTIGTSTTVLSTTSSLTKRVCSPQTLNVKLTVRDSASQTANATFTTTVYQESTCFAQCQ
jgi:hypothetical protein